jgi:hypothetical protein
MRTRSVKAQLDGTWLGSFYVITDAIDKESYSNAPYIRPGAAWLVIGRARLVGSPQKRFFHDPQRDSVRTAVATTWGLQSTRQATLVQVCIHLGLVFVFCCRGERRVKFSVPQLRSKPHAKTEDAAAAPASVSWSMLKTARRRRTTRLHDELFHKPSRTYPSKAVGPPFAELRCVV